MRLRARRAWLPIAGLALAGFAILAFLYVKSATRDESSYFENVASLRQMKELDARWDLDLIRSAVGRDTDYDALVESLRAIDVLQGSLRAAWASRPHPAAARLAQASDALARDVATKARLIDQFKSRDSVRRNSLAFLPRAAEDAQVELSRVKPASPVAVARVAAELNKLLLDAVLYSDAASPDQAIGIEAASSRLIAGSSAMPAAVRETIAVFASHVRMVLREQPLVDAIVADIDAVHPTEQIDALDRLLAGEHMQARVQGDRYRLYLLLFATGLIGLLLYAAIGLVRSHAVVARMNRNLERTNATLERARNDAEQASRAKSAFVATMSHELRTPMNGVIGMIGVLEHSKLSSEQADMLGLARDSACSLLEIIEDILDFSKIEAGRLELECVPFSVASVVAKTLALVAGVAGSRSVELTSRVEASIPAAVEGDALRLRQVLVNLISNAVKFSSGGDRAAHVAVSVGVHRLDAGRVVLDFAVEDNGIGMDEATIAALFMPFVQADTTTTRRFGGTGLGLTISRRFVELMGGEIAVRSTPGAGSTFTVRLPLNIVPASTLSSEAGAHASPSPALADRPRQAMHAPLRHELILIAEDNVINQRVITSQLRLLGFEAEVAGNGLEALALWRSGRFAVLLTDLQMPEMDGYGLTASIRSEEEGGARTPIVALTANALKGEGNRCLAVGMDAYLTKPLSIGALENMLELFLGASAGIAAAPPEPAPPEASGPVDAAMLPSLVGNDPLVLAEFMGDFSVAAAAACGQIDEAAALGRAETVASVAHRLKSSARAIGAARLGQRCEEIEATAAVAGPAEMLSLLTPFRAEVALVLNWISMNYPDQASAQPGLAVACHTGPGGHRAS